MTSDPGAEKLCRMANQIATFFDSQRGEAAEKVAAHIAAYWSPAMRADLLAHLSAGGTGLRPTARAAAERLAERLAGPTPAGSART